MKTNPWKIVWLAGIALVALFLWHQSRSLNESEAAEEKLVELQKKAVEQAEKKIVAENKAFIESLDSEELAMELHNKTIQNQIELRRARRDAQEAVDTARRDAEIARIAAGVESD